MQMQDDSLFAIPGPAVFSIDSFKMPGADGPGEAIYTLKSSALRTITGKINKGGGKYEMRAAPATVTVDGSSYSAMLCGSCAGVADGLYVKGESGVIDVGNGSGSVKLKPGQVAFVPAGGGAPVLVTKSPFNDPKFAAKFGAEFKLNQIVNPPRIENEKPASPS